MKHISTLIIIYIIIVILQIFYLKYKISNNSNNSNKFNSKIIYNNKNKDDLDKTIAELLKERVNLLHQNKMTYTQWLNYNKKNYIMKKDNYKYYIFIFECLENTNNQKFITMVHGNENYINLSWEDVLKDVSEKLVTLKYNTDINLISNMYNLSDSTRLTEIEYYWLDPLLNIPVTKKSKVFRYYDKNTKRSGVIGMGIDDRDLSIDNLYYYYEKIPLMYPIFISLLTLLVSLVLIRIKNSNNLHYRTIIFLLIVNLYLGKFLTESEYYGSNISEMQKDNTINSGIMSVSFLVGVNVFILSTLQKSLKINLFTETGFIFAVSLILLLFSTIKSINHKTTEEIISDRLSTQLMFNTAIIFNMIIIFNYILYVLSFKLGKNIIL